MVIRLLLLYSLTRVSTIIDNLIDTEKEQDFTWLYVYMSINCIDAIYRGKMRERLGKQGLRFSKAAGSIVFEKLLRVHSTSLTEYLSASTLMYHP